MSYLDKLKNNLDRNENNKPKISEVKPGWVVLNKENYMRKYKKNKDENEEEREEEKKNISETSNKSTFDNEEITEINSKRDYEEDFYIKYGDILLDLFMDMRDEFENNCYKILDKKEYGTTCFSYDFEKFVMKHTKMINDDDNNSNLSEEEEFRDDFY